MITVPKNKHITSAQKPVICNFCCKPESAIKKQLINQDTIKSLLTKNTNGCIKGCGSVLTKGVCLKARFFCPGGNPKGFNTAGVDPSFPV